jgi:hypothetical protein
MPLQQIFLKGQDSQRGPFMSREDLYGVLKQAQSLQRGPVVFPLSKRTNPLAPDFILC